MYREAIVKKEIKEGGWVLLIDGNTKSNSSCSDNCASCHSDCKKKDLVYVDDLQFAKPGDRVQIQIENQKFLIATLVSLIFPLCMMVVGIILGKDDLLWQFIYGTLFLLVGIGIAIWVDRKFKAKIKVHQIIERCYENNEEK